MATETVTAASTVVGKGGVGESGATDTINYTVSATANVKMTAQTAKTSLCPNTGAFALLFNNGVLVAFGSITDQGATIMAKASPGDQIVAYVATHPIPNDIVCVRLGELSFVLIQEA